ncbi:hypothetical protein GCM10009743_40330 [Kribbella swartbergensis]
MKPAPSPRGPEMPPAARGPEMPPAASTSRSTRHAGGSRGARLHSPLGSRTGVVNRADLQRGEQTAPVDGVRLIAERAESLPPGSEPGGVTCDGAPHSRSLLGRLVSGARADHIASRRQVSIIHMRVVVGLRCGVPGRSGKPSSPYDATGRPT